MQRTTIHAHGLEIDVEEYFDNPAPSGTAWADSGGELTSDVCAVEIVDREEFTIWLWETGRLPTTIADALIDQWTVGPLPSIVTDELLAHHLERLDIAEMIS